MSWGAVSTGTFTGTEARAGKVRVRLEAEGAQARWVGIETPWSYLVKVLDEQTWHTLVRARHGDNQEGRHSHCIQSWACRQAGRKPADSQETTAGGERRSRGGWWSVRCQQDGNSAPEAGEERQETLLLHLISFFCAFGQRRNQSGKSHAAMQQFSLQGTKESLFLQILPFPAFTLNSYHWIDLLSKGTVYWRPMFKNKKRTTWWREHKMVEK